MAHFMKTKGIDIFCSSQAATTSICLNMDEASSSSSSSSSSSIQPGLGRAIDRYNPIIRDPRRISNSPLPPCSPQPPLTPKPHNNQSNKNRKISFSKAKNEAKKKSSSSKLQQPNDIKRKNIAEPNDSNIVIRKQGWSCTKPGDFISPPGSTRYLLGDDQALLDVPSEFDPVLKLVPFEANKSIAVKTDEQFAAIPPSSRSPDQVVVLRVSLHCKGCERKMRKHISRMEGVTSFNIDFAAKKVTVVGDVTPLEVLSSISKVKNAKLWTPTMPPSLAHPVMPTSLAHPVSLNNLEPRQYQEAGE